MNSYITINKLFEKLPEDELKAVQVYFDDYEISKFDETRLNVKVLCLALVYKTNNQKLLSFKEFRELYPSCDWLIVPKRILKPGMTKQLMKVYICINVTKIN